MKALIVEDDFASSRLLQVILSPYGESHLAYNGREAVHLFEAALKSAERYDLICLDIMMPGMDGQDVLKELRSLESEYGRVGLDRCKIIMVSALDDGDNIIKSFREQAEAYIVKPISKDKLINEVRKLGLIE